MNALVDETPRDTLIVPRTVIVHDARGRPFPLFDSRVRLLNEHAIDFPQKDFRRVVKRIKSPGHSFGLRVRGGPSAQTLSKVDPDNLRGFILTGIFGVGVVAFILGTLAASPPSRGCSIAMLVMLVLVALVTGIQVLTRLVRLRTFPPASTSQIASALLAEKRCPSCAYHIGAVEPDANALLVCPECGAAWDTRKLGEHFVMFLYDNPADRTPM